MDRKLAKKLVLSAMSNDQLRAANIDTVIDASIVPICEKLSDGGRLSKTDINNSFITLDDAVSDSASNFAILRPRLDDASKDLTFLCERVAEGLFMRSHPGRPYAQPQHEKIYCFWRMAVRFNPEHVILSTSLMPCEISEHAVSRVLERADITPMQFKEARCNLIYWAQLLIFTIIGVDNIPANTLPGYIFPVVAPCLNGLLLGYIERIDLHSTDYAGNVVEIRRFGSDSGFNVNPFYSAESHSIVTVQFRTYIDSSLLDRSQRNICDTLLDIENKYMNCISDIQMLLMLGPKELFQIDFREAIMPATQPLNDVINSDDWKNAVGSPIS